MTHPPEMWVFLALNTVSILLAFGGGLFVFVQNWRSSANRWFFLFTCSTVLVTICVNIASVQTTYDAAYFWWSRLSFNCFITIAVVHFIFSVLKREKTWRWFIIATDVVGVVLFVGALLTPDWLFTGMVPFLYFGFSPLAGWWWALMTLYFFFAPLVAAGNVIDAYRHSSGVERKRLEYFILMFGIGYIIGAFNFFNTFGIPIDPIFGSLYGFYLLPIIYGIFSNQLLDIRIVVQRAFYYAGGVALIAGFLATLLLLNGLFSRTVPGFQFWTIPLIVAIVAFVVGRVVLRQAEDAERVKYEFLTVATHKLRTPLTRIRWVIPDLLAKAGDNVQVREGIRRIDDANNRLIDLTNVLLEAARPGGAYDYQQTSVDLHALLDEAMQRFITQIKEKKFNLSIDVQGAPKVLGDAHRIELVIEVLIENAVVYTPEGGLIHIEIKPEGRRVRFSIKDSGIGVAAEDQKNIFSTFYRTDAAREADTEGVGLGLALAKRVIERQGGRIGVDSEGKGKGSTFWFRMPISRV